MTKVHALQDEGDNVVTIHVYDNEEIDLFLTGDRRSIDRLMMHGLNNISAVLVSHMKWEEGVLNSLGTQTDIDQRVQWINTQIDKQKSKNAMMRKVSESTLTWAMIAFLGFVAYATWDYVQHILTVQRTLAK